MGTKWRGDTVRDDKDWSTAKLLVICILIGAALLFVGWVGQNLKSDRLENESSGTIPPLVCTEKGCGQ
jgi:hypothetical protein